MRKFTKFTVSSEEIGVFKIDVVVPKVFHGTVDLLLEDLLEMRSNNIETFDINEQVELSVNITIFVLNQLASK